MLGCARSRLFLQPRYTSRRSAPAPSPRQPDHIDQTAMKTMLETNGQKSAPSSSEASQPFDRDAPPSYSVLIQHPLPPSHKDQEAILTCILTVLARERSLPRVPHHTTFPPPPALQLLDLEREAARLRTFLLHTVAVDYKCPLPVALPALGCFIPAVLTPDDRAFFVRLGTWFIQLHRAHRVRRIPAQDISTFAPYLLRYLDAPTHHDSVRIPVDVVVVAIIRYLRSVQQYGEYRSCVSEVLRNDGMHRFAEKSWWDQVILKYVLMQEPAVQAGMRRRAEAVAGQYVVLGNPARNQPLVQTYWWGDRVRIPYTLNEEGRAYEKNRAGGAKRLQAWEWICGLRGMRLKGK